MSILQDILKDFLTIFKCKVSILRCKAAMYWTKRAQKCLDNHDIDGFFKYHERALICMPNDLKDECVGVIRRTFKLGKKSIDN